MGADPAFVRPALAACTPADAMAFFASIGVECAAREDGKVYPLPAQAAAVLDCLRLEAAGAGRGGALRRGGAGYSAGGRGLPSHPAGRAGAGPAGSGLLRRRGFPLPRRLR